MADSAHEGGTGGKKFWGDKTLAYAKKLSRESVEKHTDTSVLYFEVDVERSKRNFYGELTVKAFVNPQGIAVNGIIKLEEGGDIVQEDIPNKLMTMEFSCYINHLQELGIDPRLGDYFATKNRIYFIYDKRITDSNSASVGVDREAVTMKYRCVQADDEQLFPGIWGLSDGGTPNDILGTRQLEGGNNISGINNAE